MLQRLDVVDRIDLGPAPASPGGAPLLSSLLRHRTAAAVASSALLLAVDAVCTLQWQRETLLFFCVKHCPTSPVLNRGSSLYRCLLKDIKNWKVIQSIIVVSFTKRFSSQLILVSWGKNP